MIMSFICRTCMQVNAKYVKIFDHHANGKMFSDMLEEFARIKIEESDGLPTYICSSCLEKLTAAWDFRVMIIEADSLCHHVFKKSVEETLILSNNSISNMTVVKEESVVKYELPASLKSKDEYTKNSSRLDSLPERNSSSSIPVNCPGDKTKYECQVKLLQNNADEDSSNKSTYTFSCENDTSIPEITVNSSPFAMSKNHQIETAYNIKQDITSNLLNLNYHCMEEWINKNFRSNKKNDTTKNKDTLQKMQESIIEDTCIENGLITHDEDGKILKDNQYNSDGSISSSDISVSSIMEIKFESEKVGKKLTKKEKKNISVFCKICKRSFSYRYYFEDHIKHHNGNKKSKCSICSKTFVRQYHLKLHMRVHSDEKPLSCETCGKKFKYRSALYTHKSVHSNDRQYICDSCQKSFKTKTLLKAHVQRHKKEKPFTCEVCGKSFGDPSTFYKHKLIHVDGKRFACPTCGKRFITNWTMRAHLKLHSEIRPHVCNYCGKSFKTKDVMDTHILIHTGNRPHSCKFCDKSFRQSSALFNHMRIHTGETPYACKLCPSQFKYSHHLQNHIKVHN